MRVDSITGEKLKRCSTCERHLTLDNFTPRPNRKCGVVSSCKECVSIKQKEQRAKMTPEELEADKLKQLKKYYTSLEKYRARVPIYRERAREKEMIRLYGITVEYYNKLVIEQNNCCAICKKPETELSKSGEIRKLSIDHCHTTNKVRGLLCTKCNKGIGCFNDDFESLQNATDYIKRHNT